MKKALYLSFMAVMISMFFFGTRCLADEYEHIIVEEAIIGGEEEEAPVSVPEATTQNVGQVPETKPKVQKKKPKIEPKFSGSVQIIHSDADTKEPVGSDLILLDADGNERKIVSGEEVTDLKEGSYSILETRTAKGYMKLPTETFTLSKEQPRYEATIKSQRIYGSIKVRFADESGNELAGCRYMITSPDGEDVTDSQKLPIGIYEDGELSEYLTYTLKASSLPEGYETDFMEQEISFTSSDNTVNLYEKDITILCKKVEEKVTEPEIVSENTISQDTLPEDTVPIQKHKESMPEKIRGWFMEVTNGIGIDRIIKVIAASAMIAFILIKTKKKS